jgi:hypothetical protein
MYYIKRTLNLLSVRRAARNAEHSGGGGQDAFRGESSISLPQRDDIATVEFGHASCEWRRLFEYKRYGTLNSSSCS